MSKHTKGPWIYSEGSQHILTGQSGTYTALCTPLENPSDQWGMHKISRDERKANARLIAASPSMFDMLKSLWAEAMDRGDQATAIRIATVLGPIERPE